MSCNNLFALNDFAMAPVHDLDVPALATVTV